MPLLEDGGLYDQFMVIKNSYGCSIGLCDRSIAAGVSTVNKTLVVNKISDYLEKGIVVDKPTPIDRINMCLKHIEYLSEIKIEKLVCLEIRNHIAWYLKGLKNSNEIKNKL